MKISATKTIRTNTTQQRKRLEKTTQLLSNIGGYMSAPVPEPDDPTPIDPIQDPPTDPVPQPITE